MADISKLTRALQRAHSAGDTQAARRLASEIRRVRAEGSVRHPEFDPSNVPGGVPGYNAQTGLVERTPPSLMDSAAIGALDTATLGFGDELAGLLGGPQVRDNMRELQTASRETNPWSHVGGQVGGGALLAAATRGASFLPNATSLAGRALGGAMTGAAYGGAYGAGSGEGVGGRTQGALRDGSLGALMGGMFPVVAAGAGRAYQGVRDWMSAAPIARRAGSSPEALRVLGGVLDADGSLGPQGRANMARAGNEAMLADAGPTARRALDTAIQRSGPGAVVARNAIDARVGRDTGALVQSLDDVLGSPQGVGSAQRAISDASRPGVNAAYQRAYSLPIDYSTDAGRAVEDVFRRMPSSMTRKAVQQANELMQWDNLPRQIMADIADDGSIAFREMPGVVQADYVKKALDRIVQDGTDELTGKLSGDALLASRIARELRTAVGDAVPAYREALETAADPLSRQAAVRLGSRLLSPSVTRDQVNAAVQGMTTPERQALAQGVRSQIDDAMANVSRTVQDGDTPAREAVKALRDLSSRANREKLSAAIGQDEASRLFDELDRVAQSFDLRAGVSSNSATYARQAMDQRIKDTTALGPMGRAARGEPLPATKEIIRALTGHTDEAMRGREDALYGEIARLLTTQGGPGQGVYSAIGRIGQSDMATQLMKESIIRALAGPHLSYPSTVLAGESLR